MNMYRHRLLSLLGCVSAAAIFTATANADPLTGEVLKFEQKPMIATAVTGQIYFGHDELSTAYGDISQPVVSYTGRFMADDFADKFNTPVVHLTWRGSYINDNNAAFPQPHVKNFLIAFESDVPANTATGVASHPGCIPVGCNPVLQSDVVSLGALAPGSVPSSKPSNAPAIPSSVKCSTNTTPSSTSAMSFLKKRITFTG